MQNKYVADIGDYGKYTLLYELQKVKLEIAINWYLVENQELLNSKEEETNAGKFTTYLDLYHKDAKRYQSINPFLYEILKEIVNEDKRSVLEIESSHFFKKDTIFFNEPISYQNRSHWFQKALSKVKSCDLVFLDPDNGLIVPSARGIKKIKYVLFEEVNSIYNSGQSILIYQHFARGYGKKFEQAEKYKSQLKSNLGSDNIDVRCIYYGKGSARYFLLIVQPEHKEKIDTFLNKIKNNADYQWLFEYPIKNKL